MYIPCFKRVNNNRSGRLVRRRIDRTFLLNATFLSFASAHIEQSGNPGIQLVLMPFRCPLRVGTEVLLVMRLGQRVDSWPYYSSERLGEGVKGLITGASENWLFFCALRER